MWWVQICMLFLAECLLSSLGFWKHFSSAPGCVLLASRRIPARGCLPLPANMSTGYTGSFLLRLFLRQFVRMRTGGTASRWVSWTRTLTVSISTSSWTLGACLISWPCKAWLGSQALASHSPAKDGQTACLIGLAKLSQAEAFFVFDCSRQPGPRPTTKPGRCLIRSKPRPARATELHERKRRRNK
jgi:hypothetical protein